jgi:pyruvate/2-oxoacid:ferredoxin oxidoreductase alpha subunit
MTSEKAAPTSGKGFRDAVPSYNGTEQVDRAGHKVPFTAPADVAPLFMKGNEAIIHGALLAGCRTYFGYPITPASEIAHTAAALFPPTGGVFLQAESEVAAINMVYGAAASGVRTMTASSSPGMSLKQEGISYSAGAELPMVIVDITRGGPGLGNIAPEQGDYWQMVKGGGHGCYRTPVLAPNSCQEMCDLTILAFEMADRYRTPAVVLADGLVGQMKEPVYLPEPLAELPDTSGWSVQGNAETRENLVCSIFLSADELESHITHLDEKYKAIEARETRWEEYKVEDADIILTGYGIVSRILKGVVDMGRKQGLKLGLLRPITLFPFPDEALRAVVRGKKACMAVELSTGQYVEDVRLAVSDLAPVWFYGRAGGNLPSVEEILEEVIEKSGMLQEVQS